MQFANGTLVQGRTAVREVMTGFWATVAGMHHAFTNVFEDGDQTLLEADVTYTRLDASTVLIKTGTVIRRRSGLVADQHVCVDLAPRFGQTRLCRHLGDRAYCDGGPAEVAMPLARGDTPRGSCTPLAR